LVSSSQGGMDIETVAAEQPEAIITQSVNINTGLQLEVAKEVARKSGFPESAVDEVPFFTSFLLFLLFLVRDVDSPNQ